MLNMADVVPDACDTPSLLLFEDLMLTSPHVYGGDCPFMLVFDADRERVVRFLADAGVAMILTTEGTSLSRVELPGCDRRQALRLVERMNRRQWRGELDGGEHRGAMEALGAPNRLRRLGLLDDSD